MPSKTAKELLQNSDISGDLREILEILVGKVPK